MTKPFDMEEAHKVCAEVVGELSLAITRKKGDKATMLGWIARLRIVADAFEYKVNAAKRRGTGEPRMSCMLCEGTGSWETCPEELGWRRVDPHAWVTDRGIRIPAHMKTVWVACPCTEREA